jgi:colanic acid/amylovoran biosynthesis glycosyltransferase
MNLAIISTNKDKYSETFIHNHVKRLPGNIHLLFDGYLPKQYSGDKGLTSGSLSGFKKKSWLKLFRSKSNPHRELRTGLERYLKHHRIDVLLCEYGPGGVEMLPLAKKLNIPLVVHFHGYDAYRNDILNSYGKYYKNLFAYAGAVIAVSGHMQAQLIALGCDVSSLHTLRYGIDTSVFKLVPTMREEHTFVACGRFVEKKAPQHTIRAFKQVLEKFPGAKLIMIGDGELLDASMALVLELMISGSVEFTGVLNQQEIAGIFRRATAFVQHSVTSTINDSEGTPLTIMEAMACGLAVVTTKHGGIPDIIQNGETGFLVDEHDVDGMAEHMCRIVSDPEQARLMGERASEKIMKEHCLLKYTDELWRIIKLQKNN